MFQLQLVVTSVSLNGGRMGGSVVHVTVLVSTSLINGCNPGGYVQGVHEFQGIGAHMKINKNCGGSCNNDFRKYMLACGIFVVGITCKKTQVMDQ